MTRPLAWPRSPPGAHCIVKAPPAVRLRGAACVCAELGRQVVEVVRGLARVAPVRAALFTGGHPFSTHRRMLDEVRADPPLWRTQHPPWHPAAHHGVTGAGWKLGRGSCVVAC